MLEDDTTLHTTGKSVVQILKTLQLCLDRISVWCNVNHMLINPVKTKSMIITTRQKHLLSDLSLRLSLDGQNIENVTEHRLLGLVVDKKCRWQAQIEHICKTCNKNCFFFLNCDISSTDKLILPDPSLFTEQKMSALGILNLPQQLAYNKGIFMYKVLNNNPPNYLAQLFISHQSHYTNDNLYVLRPRLDLFITSIYFAGTSLWNSLPQNIKSCISLPCFKRNLHKYISENNLSSNLGGFI